SWLSWLVGRPLIRLNADRYAREADLRYSLVRVHEHVDAISVARGEADGRRRLELDLANLLAATPGDADAVVRLGWNHHGDRRRLWLDHRGRADRDRLASLLRGQHDVRRADDGGRRLQPGALLAALVRRSHRRHRRLARDAAACGRLPRGDDEGR